MSTTKHRSREEQAFKTVAPGVHFSFLRRHGDDDSASPGLTVLIRMDKGTHAQRHGHPGGEETYMVSGKLRVGERMLLSGDYLWTAPGESHDAFAEEESLFFVVLPGGFDLTADAPAA